MRFKVLFFFIHSAAHSNLNPATLFSKLLPGMLLGDRLLGDEHFSSVTVEEPWLLLVQKRFK